jgi:hypothetical protein
MIFFCRSNVDTIKTLKFIKTGREGCIDDAKLILFCFLDGYRVSKGIVLATFSVGKYREAVLNAVSIRVWRDWDYWRSWYNWRRGHD